MNQDTNRLLNLGVIAQKLVQDKKGLLAIDESPSSMENKFAVSSIPNTEKNRTIFRDLLISTDGFEKYISGVILHEEMFLAKDENGRNIVDKIRDKGVCVGIKLDKGLIDFSNKEKISVGLEDLENRIKHKKFANASFAKWRSLFIVSNDLPTNECLDENCHILAKYAKICQDNGLVPIVEPELYFKGEYSLESAKYNTKRILSDLFKSLNYQKVYIPGVIVKMSFVTQGDETVEVHSPNEIGMATLDALLSTIPCGVPGIVFLSGGHSQDDAINYLSAVNELKACKTWNTSFSFGRTLTDESLKSWGGKETNIQNAQQTFLCIAEKCYSANMKSK